MLTLAKFCPTVNMVLYSRDFLFTFHFGTELEPDLLDPLELPETPLKSTEAMFETNTV